MSAWVDTKEGFREEIGNQLTGSLPPELASLPYLRVLDLSNNHLTGPIPPELGQLSQLHSLCLYENELMGPIPPELGQLSRLERLGLDNNDLTVVPFLWTSEPDSSIVDMAKGMAADPEGHGLLWHTRTLLPIGGLEVTAHEPVMSSSNNAFTLLSETKAIHAMEGASGHYMGMMSGSVTGGAVAEIPGKTSFSGPVSRVIGHELGHNLNLSHAPCGGAGGPDPSFPEPDGSIGAWGYDFREKGRLVPPTRPDKIRVVRSRSRILRRRPGGTDEAAGFPPCFCEAFVLPAASPDTI